MSSREKGSAISRVMQIIDAVATAERPLSPADLACQLAIPKPSIHRLLNQLESDGFIQTNMRGMIVPSAKMHGIAWGVLHSDRFSTSRRAILQRLTEEIGETCGIAIPNGTEMIYYDRVQTDSPLQINLQVGSRTPIWCTASGKLYLSSLAKEKRQRLINNLSLTRYTRNTMVDGNALETALQQIKIRRLGIDNEEFVDGMVACAVPVNNSNGTLCACLFTHAPVIRKSLDSLLGYTAQLQSAAQELGYLIDNPDQ